MRSARSRITGQQAQVEIPKATGQVVEPLRASVSLFINQRRSAAPVVDKVRHRIGNVLCVMLSLCEVSSALKKPWLFELETACPLPVLLRSSQHPVQPAGLAAAWAPGTEWSLDSLGKDSWRSCLPFPCLKLPPRDSIRMTAFHLRDWRQSQCLCGYYSEARPRPPSPAPWSSGTDFACSPRAESPPMPGCQLPGPRPCVLQFGRWG